jgi:hypothetical protein
MTETGGILGMVVPVEVGRADDARVRQRRWIGAGCKVRARLEQQDAALCVGAQSRGKNCAGRAASDNDDIEHSL